MCDNVKNFIEAENNNNKNMFLFVANMYIALIKTEYCTKKK